MSILRSRVEEKPVNKRPISLLQLLLFLIVAMREAIIEVYRARMAEFAADDRAFSTSLVGAALGIVILAIVVLDVAIPVVTSAISTANLTGTTLTIANLIPMFLVLGLFVMVAVVFVIRWL